MRPKTVITYGMPRSGTTFMDRWLRAADGFANYKLPETVSIHPCLNDRGLIDLYKLVHWPLFVRTVRNPVDIVKSTFVLRRIGKGEFNPVVFGHKILNNAVNEHNNTTAQNGITTLGIKPLIVYTVDYDRLGDPAYQSEVISYICKTVGTESDISRLQVWITENWGINPMRRGRLSSGMDAELPPCVSARAERMDKFNPGEIIPVDDDDDGRIYMRGAGASD